MSDDIMRLIREAEPLRQWHLKKWASRHRHLRDDLDSKTLEAVWKAAVRFVPPGDFSPLAGAWIRGAVKQVLKGDLPHGYRQRVRAPKGQVLRPCSLLDHADALSCEGRCPASLDETGNFWESAMGLLTERQAEVLTLHYGYGLGTAEIARQLGVFEQSVANSIRQATARLRKRLPPPAGCVTGGAST